MHDAPQISVIITAHREGLLAGPALRSAEAAIAAAAGLSCEVIVVLDHADALTASVLAAGFGGAARLIDCDAGDPAVARNLGVAAARGRFSAFLDADDLWSENWLVAAWDAATARPDAVFHAACLMRFGSAQHLFWQIDSESALFDPEYLLWRNYWDAMSFAETAIYRRLPFRANDLDLGFGHEDWEWNRRSLQAGFAHKPVPGTVHFKRGRAGSQMSLVERMGGVTWPDGLQTKPEKQKTPEAGVALPKGRNGAARED